MLMLLNLNNLSQDKTMIQQLLYLQFPGHHHPHPEVLPLRLQVAGKEQQYGAVAVLLGGQH